MRLTLLLVIAMAGVGCGDPVRSVDAPTPVAPVTWRINPMNGGGYGVTRFVDTEAGVVCWLGTGSGTSITCLPISATTLPPEPTR